MYQGTKVAVVLPAYNEENFITKALESIPDLADAVILVDDCSTDNTLEIARAWKDPRLIIIRHRYNKGVGGAILSGYSKAIKLGFDIAVVMAGDGQMHPDDLGTLLDPLILNKADYAKGNRLFHPLTPSRMPLWRFFGNAALSLLTRISSGYPHIVDSQCGYTAIRLKSLKNIDFSRVYPRYGFPNDFLAHLHSQGVRVSNVEVRPVYSGQKTGIKASTAVFSLSFVLCRSFVLRLLREQKGGWS